MKIICNTRCMDANFTGVQRYTHEMLKNFPLTIDQFAPSHGQSRGLKGHLWEQFTLPRKLKGSLLFSPSNTGPITYARQVVVLHDVVTLDHPEWFNKRFTTWYNWILPKLVKKVDHVITISEFTKSRIVEKLNVSDTKISVIYNGVDHDFWQNKDNEIKLPFKRYILALGSIEPRKNLVTLVNAWKNILNSIPEDVGLVIAGKKGNSLIFNEVNLGVDLERIHFTGFVEEQYMATLFSNALCFCYLSSYEGFGLPPLEAMSAGCPVLVGNLTSIPEVINGCGKLVDPFSLEEIESALSELINNPTTRDYYSKIGLRRSQEFSWKKAANETWDILQRF